MSSPTNQTADESRGIVDLTESERHRLLAVERRRVVLEALADGQSTFDLRELAREVAAREDGPTGEETVDAVALALHHVHLPKMADLGVVAYDATCQQVKSRHGVATL